MEIVTAIIAMGHALRLNVLAEGVEQPEQLNYLRTQGCDQFQGYLTSQPIPAAAFEALLRQHHRSGLRDAEIANAPFLASADGMQC